MRRLVSILLSFVLLFSGCGGSDASSVPIEEGGAVRTISGGPEGRFATVSLGSWQAAPRIDPPAVLPPQKEILVRDIRVGRGPVARKGDRVAVYYQGVSYETGDSLYSTWRPADPYEVTLGALGAYTGWEESIVGMRAGGRREVVIPSHRAFKAGAMIYVTELIAVKPASRRGGEQ